MAECLIKGKKTFWEKEKLLIAQCFQKRLELHTRKNQGLFGKGFSAPND